MRGDKSGYDIKSLKYYEEKTKIELNELKLNKKFGIKDIKDIHVVTYKKNIKNNDFNVLRSNRKKYCN